MTNVHEIADGIYRVSTPVPESIIGIPGGFTFNQFLIDDDEPMLWHTGPRRMFPLVRDAAAKVLAVDRLRWIAFSHVESDEMGALNEWLAAAPQAAPMCGEIGAMVSVQDLADRPPRALHDGEEISLGRHRLRWLDAPHMPHNWECGYLFETTTRTFLCGDLLAQPGDSGAALSERDIVGPAVGFERAMPTYARSPGTRAAFDRFAALAPATLACMHGSSFRGDAGRALRDFAGALEL